MEKTCRLTLEDEDRVELGSMTVTNPIRGARALQSSKKARFGKLELLNLDDPYELAIDEVKYFIKLPNGRVEECDYSKWAPQIGERLERLCKGMKVS